MTAPLPRMLWIELTSTCPFHCSFCCREFHRGQGEHLEWRFFQSLMAGLKDPDVICLNYAGESVHYPHILEAILLAKSTGAHVELVTAFSSLSSRLLKGLVDSGLDRLSLSLHTLDPEQYSSLYGFGSLDRFLTLFRELRTYQKTKGPTPFRSKGRLEKRIPGDIRPSEMRPPGLTLGQTPHVDISYVALRENLNQLPLIARFASQNEISEIFLHPILWREVKHPLFQFPYETCKGRLTGQFRDELLQCVSAVQAQFPDVTIDICNPEVKRGSRLLEPDGRWAASPLAHQRLLNCEQNPWETVHVVSNGDVVVCELQDMISMGNLGENSIQEIWQGLNYQEFRRRYLRREVSICWECPWLVHLDGWPADGSGSKSDATCHLLNGWHFPGDGQILWSKQSGLAVMRNRPGQPILHLQGILPHRPEWPCNLLTIECNGYRVGSVENLKGDMMGFEEHWELSFSRQEWLHFRFTVSQLYRPVRYGDSADQRALGFGLIKLALG